MLTLSNQTRLVMASGFVICALIFAIAYPGIARANPLLGTAQSFSVLGGSGVTNTGTTNIGQDLGVSPASSITGFPPGIVGGTIHETDAVASQAQSDVTIAYNALAGEACDTALTGQDLGGLTLIPGVYCFTSSAQLTGTLTLDSKGDPDAVFIFQIASTLTTASNSSVVMIGGTACNVFWQVGSSATIGTNTAFIGNILALTSITLNTGATLQPGRALARNGAVTMDTNVVSAAGCMTTSETPPPSSATPVTPTATTTATLPTLPVVTSTTTPATPTSTPVSSVPGTQTPVVTEPGVSGTAGASATETSIPGATNPADMTSTPGATNPADMTSTPGAPATVATVDAATTPTVGLVHTPEIWSTSTPEATGTAVPVVTFPSTGSGGLLAEQGDQSLLLVSLAASMAAVLLLTGGLATFVERRNRR